MNVTYTVRCADHPARMPRSKDRCCVRGCSYPPPIDDWLWVTVEGSDQRDDQSIRLGPACPFHAIAVPAGGIGEYGADVNGGEVIPPRLDRY